MYFSFQIKKKKKKELGEVVTFSKFPIDKWSSWDSDSGVSGSRISALPIECTTCNCPVGKGRHNSEARVGAGTTEVGLSFAFSPIAIHN